MEEEIKVLEENINNGTLYCLCGNTINKAIENLIKGYKELEEEHQKRIMLALNKELIIVNNKMYTIDKELYNDLLNDTVNNYIPKSKVQELLDIDEIGVVHCRLKRLLEGDDK